MTKLETVYEKALEEFENHKGNDVGAAYQFLQLAMDAAKLKAQYGNTDA